MAQASLELVVILLLQPLKCWDYSFKAAYPVQIEGFRDFY